MFRHVIDISLNGLILIVSMILNTFNMFSKDPTSYVHRQLIDFQL